MVKIGTIIEVEKSQVIVMTVDLNVVHVKRKIDMCIGQKISFEENDIIYTTKNMPKIFQKSEASKARSRYRQMVIDLAYDILKKIAPEEIPLFKTQSEYYFKNPKEALISRAYQQDMFGFDKKTVFITPTIFRITNEALDSVCEKTKWETENKKIGFWGKKIKLLKKKIYSNEAGIYNKLPMPLRPEQVSQVNRYIMERAFQLDLPKEKANILANFIDCHIFVSK